MRLRICPVSLGTLCQVPMAGTTKPCRGHMCDHFYARGALIQYFSTPRLK